MLFSYRKIVFVVFSLYLCTQIAAMKTLKGPFFGMRKRQVNLPSDENLPVGGFSGFRKCRRTNWLN